jgi:hypothetical protein
LWVASLELLEIVKASSDARNKFVKKRIASGLPVGKAQHNLDLSNPFIFEDRVRLEAALEVCARDSYRTQEKAPVAPQSKSKPKKREAVFDPELHRLFYQDYQGYLARMAPSPIAPEDMPF